MGGKLSNAELADLLSSGTVKLSDHVGDVVTILGYRMDDGQYGPFARIDAIIDGQPVEITSGGAVIVPQLERLAKADAFPVDMRVASFAGQFGKDGYRFDAP